MIPHRLTTLFAAGFVLLCANAAEAGFVSIDLDGTAQGFAVAPDNASGSSAPTTESDPEPVPRTTFERNDLAMQPSGGMSTTAGHGPTSQVPTPALAAVAVDASAQLIAWLGPEGRVWLPPPFSTGVFRPPRV